MSADPRVAELERDVRNLTQALETRDVISMAKGLLMAMMRCGPDEAFRLLVSQSQHQNVKLYDIAAEIVARHVASLEP